MSDHREQSPGDSPPASEAAGNPNSGCALAATGVGFILSVFVLSSFVFVSQEQKMVKAGGLFSSAKYETVNATSWLPVIFWTTIFCGAIYWLVLWKRSKPLIWLGLASCWWLKNLADGQKRANAAKPVVPSYQAR